MQNPSHPSPREGADADGSDVPPSGIEPPTKEGEPPAIGDRMALFQAVIDALSEAVLPEEVARIVAGRGIAATGADSAFVAVLTQDGTALEQLDALGYPSTVRTEFLRFSIDRRVPLADAVRTGEPVIIESYEELAERYSFLLPLTTPQQALIALPLTVKRRIIGGIGFGFSAPRVFDPSMLRLVHALAGQCAQAIERANLYRAGEQAIEQMARLQSMTAALGEALTFDRVADVMAEQGMTVLGASSGLFLFLPTDEKGEQIIRTMGGAADSIERWQQTCPGSPCPVTDALDRGEMLLVESRAKIGELYPELAAVDPETMAIATIPIIVDGRGAGCIGLAFQEARVFSSHERSFMLALAQQCANALERARLFEAERHARAAAESARRREQFLAEASAQLNASLDYSVTLTNVARSAVPYLADYCTVYFFDDGELQCLTTAHQNPTKQTAALEYINAYHPDPGRFTSLFEAIATGEPQTARNISVEQLASLGRDESERQMLVETGIHAWMVVPLIGHDVPLGALTLSLDDPSRGFTDEEMTLAVELARRAAMALDNARLHREAQRTAEQKREALALLNTFFEAAPTGMAVRDLDLRYLRVNPAMAKILGMTVEEMINGTIGELIPDLALTIEPLMRRAIETRRPVTDVEVTGELPDTPGIRRHWLTSHYPICSDDGIPYGVGTVVHEITDRKTFEQEILTSQERFRVAAECASDIIYEWEVASGRVNYYRDIDRGDEEADHSRSFEGWKRSLHPDDRERVTAAIARHFETGEPFFEEYRVVGHDGGITIWTDRGRLLRNEAGEGVRWIGVMSDITERKQAEDALRESEARFRMLVSSMDDMIFTIDRDQRTTGAFGSWFGLAQEGTQAMVGKAPRDIVGPESAALHEAANARALQGERVVYEWSFDTILGAQYLQTSLSPIRNARNEIVGVVGVGHNITERKKAEQRLQESEELSRAILGALTAHIAVIDRNGTILVVNEAWERFGREHDARPSYLTGVGANYLDVCRKAAARGNTEALNTLIGLRSILDGTRDQFTMEYTIELGSSLRWFLLNATPLAGSREGAVISHTDITDQKLAELESQAARDAAETAGRAKDRFLATLGNELRTPLTPALILAEALENDPSLPERSRREIELIRRNVELEARLIDDLLDYTRSGQERMRLERERVDAHQLLRNVIRAGDGGRGSERRQIIVALDATHHHLHADPVRLQQVFRHLIGNAVKFTPEGGTITIRTGDTDGGSFRATITDTGRGFEPESAAALFDAFEGRDERDDDGIRESGSAGIGLGLGLSRRIVEMHGGTITASSEGKGKGASFSVELAAIGTGEAGSDDETTEILPPATGARVLLVEDHADTREVLALMLRRWGYEVETAGTMEEGMLATSGAQFDLLISDVHLSDGNGYELLARIDPDGRMKAIAFSGFGMEEDMRRSREAGFQAHIAKPVTARKLLAAIIDAIG